MAPSFRSRQVADEEKNSSTEDNTSTTSKKQPLRMWERRKRRVALRKERQEAAAAAEVDPYESDPGESYREHCLKFKGISTKTCLPRPFENRSVLTAPPSPLASETDSFPARLQSRIKYSLRSTITDGSEAQPAGPTVMERRELRPNAVHVNVSHWSDEGGRPYMEDRYVKEECYLYMVY